MFSSEAPEPVDIAPQVTMKALKYHRFVGKVAGFVYSIGVIPFVDPIGHSTTDGTKEKERLGKLLEERSGGQCFFEMVKIRNRVGWGSIHAA